MHTKLQLCILLIAVSIQSISSCACNTQRAALLRSYMQNYEIQLQNLKRNLSSVTCSDPAGPNTNNNNVEITSQQQDLINKLLQLIQYPCPANNQAQIQQMQQLQQQLAMQIPPQLLQPYQKICQYVQKPFIEPVCHQPIVLPWPICQNKTTTTTTTTTPKPTAAPTCAPVKHCPCGGMQNCNCQCGGTKNCNCPYNNNNNNMNQHQNNQNQFDKMMLMFANNQPQQCPSCGNGNCGNCGNCNNCGNNGCGCGYQYKK